MTFRLTAPCHFGLEKTLSFEVRRIGGEDIAVSDGRVTFTGDERVLIRANMCLSTAERVGILLSEFKARTFEDLFQGVKAIPIEKYVGKFDRFPIKGFSLNSKLTSVPACQMLQRSAALPSPQEVTGECQAMPAGRCGWQIWNSCNSCFFVAIATLILFLYQTGLCRLKFILA